MPDWVWIIAIFGPALALVLLALAGLRHEVRAYRRRKARKGYII